jgi:glycogen operon protein
LRDLVSYNDKHNEANLDDNSSGEDHNRSWNCGVEGETDDEAVLALRARQQRNFLATLFLSQGVPMLLGGDEFGRTQQGNNNTYCQDNELAWYDWDWSDEQRALLAFTRSLIHLRRRHPVLRRQTFFFGETRGGMQDVDWMRPDGSTMAGQDWGAGILALMFFLNGQAMPTPDERGRRVIDDSFLVLTNASQDTVTFQVPGERYGKSWSVAVDSADPASDRREGGRQLVTGDTVDLIDHSLLVLRRTDDASGD